MTRGVPWLLLAVPALCAAQSARVGSAPGAGGTVVGRVCADLDRDGACSKGEPGVGGARVRFEDGRLATADADGRFHVAGMTTRVLLSDRSAYGDHAVAVEGLGVSRRFELAPGGMVSVDLPVALDAVAAEGWTMEALGAGTPVVEGDAIRWPLSGLATPGATVRCAGSEARAGADGRWRLAVPVVEGANALGVAVADAEGAVALWSFELRLARPSEGPLRFYPSRPRRLATLRVVGAGEGTLVAGSAIPSVALRLAGRPVRAAADGRFAAWSASEAGGVALQANVGDAVVEASLPVGEADRRFRGLLLGSAELQVGGDAGFLATGRLAGSLQGRWRGFDVDAGVDLDDRDRKAIALSSPRDASAAAQLIDPQRTFVVTGDGAAVDDANRERGRLWARAAGHGAALQLGTTRVALEAPELGRYERQLFGGRIAGERSVGPVRLGGAAFGAYAGADSNGLSSGAPLQERLAATGGSLYFLGRRDLVAGSERVRVEWVDPVSRLTVASRELAKGRDYDLDVVGGRLLLTRPLPTTRARGAIVGGDPFAGAEAWLVVDYLQLGVADGRNGVAGGEARGELGPVALAVGGATETRAGRDWQLARAGLTLDLGAPLRARVDVARTEGSLFGAGGRATSMDGGFAFGQAGFEPTGAASALHAQVEGDVGGARWTGWWRERAAGYSDDQFEQRVAARERGLLAQGPIGPVALRVAWVEQRGADPRDPDGLTLRDVGRGWASATLTVGAFDVALEGLHERGMLPERGSQSAAGLRGGWRAGRGLTLEAEHLQAFGTSGDVVERTFTSAGASLQTQEGTLALRAGWGPELGPRLLLSGERPDGDDALYGTLAVDPAGHGAAGADGSAIGGRQRLPGGTLFTEERVGRDAWGAVAGRVVGAALTPAEGLALVLSAERGERWLDGETLARSAGAVSAAWAKGDARFDARAELRAEGSGSQWLAGAGADWLVSPRLTLSAHGLASDGELRARRARGGEGWLSAAWRADRLSALARIGRVKDDREGVAQRDATIGAVAVTAKITRRAALGLGVDVAGQTVGGARDSRLSGSVRGEVGVIGPLDVALEYARRGSLDGRELGDLDALRAEAGLTAGGARLALGYTLVGFRGSGVDPEEEGDGRFYLRAVLVR